MASWLFHSTSDEWLFHSMSDECWIRSSGPWQPKFTCNSMVDKHLSCALGPVDLPDHAASLAPALQCPQAGRPLRGIGRCRRVRTTLGKRLESSRKTLGKLLA